MPWWSVLLLLVFTLFVFMGVPPLSIAAGRFVEEHWVVSSMLGLQRTLLGAHTSLLVTESCRAGVFDAVQLETRALQTRERKDDGTTLWAAREFAKRIEGEPVTLLLQDSAACASVAAIAARMTKDGVQPDQRRLRLLLVALEAIGLLHSCTTTGGSAPHGTVPGFRNARHTERFLVSKRPLQNADGNVAAVDNKDCVCGMGIIANDRLVLDRLGRLSSTLYQPRQAPSQFRFLRAALPGGGEADDGALWTAFATHSAAFSSDTATAVAAQIGSLVDRWATQRSQEIKKGPAAGQPTQEAPPAAAPKSSHVVVVDIGCASGEFLRAAVDELGRSAPSIRLTAVYADLVAPLVETKRHHEAWMASHPHRRPAATFSFVGGSVFDAGRQAAIAAAACSDFEAGANVPSLVVLMMNSFLQHVAPADASGLIRQLISQLSYTQTCGRGRLWVNLVITELVVPHDDHFNVWTELTSMARIFSGVLGAFTEDGEVRSEASYLAIAAAGGCSPATQRSLFPMPATVFGFDCRRMVARET